MTVIGKTRITTCRPRLRCFVFNGFAGLGLVYVLFSGLAPGVVPAMNAQQILTRPAVPISPAPAQGSTTPVATVGSIGAVDPSTYVLAPQDTIDVNVFKEPTISGSFPIRPDGMISVSLVGDIKAAGLTPAQLASAVTDKLSKFIQNPNVTVTVLGVQPKEIFLLGEAMRVGPVLLASGMTPLQAISAAGGLSPYANSKRIYILRTTQGKQQKIPFDYKKALKSGDQQGITLLPGDTIVIP